MHLTQSFEENFITKAGTDLSEVDEDVLREYLRQVVLGAVGIPADVDADDIVEACLISFVAGRTWQTNFNHVAVEMTPRVLALFFEFMNEQIVKAQGR